MYPPAPLLTLPQRNENAGLPMEKEENQIHGLLHFSKLE